MRKIMILFLLVSTIGFSQETIKNEVGSFNELKVFNGLNVSIEKGSTRSIEISGKKADEVVVKNINGRLKLSMRFPETFNSDEVEITLFYSNDINVIDANEGSYIGSDGTLSQQNVELKTQEGAIIDLDLDVKYLTVKSVTGGQVYTSGNAENQDIEVTTGGAYKAYDLKSNYSTVMCASGGIVNINVSELLDAKVRLGGKILYKGSPKEVKTKKIIGGTIKSKD
ncbi:head GIN domain-containing protein [Urechidicola croceus]|uniref:Putative auto-transporter adhesin head GIN domain-containing protein n=1 Tax=Urechidicola croceus TaxID=1850246 RepID=A0A1D8P982_9FLAO|nr:head GIN domain-containing protein [Urechidicola croceus]AOW21109.1 hypothetical protein LPB138_10650 [Urechidicola croceus]